MAKPTVTIPEHEPPGALEVVDDAVGDGAGSSGAGGVIGPKETLVFVVDLLDVR
jgi:hypothetical protein